MVFLLSFLKEGSRCFTFLLDSFKKRGKSEATALIQAVSKTQKGINPAPWSGRSLQIRGFPAWDSFGPFGITGKGGGAWVDDLWHFVCAFLLFVFIHFMKPLHSWASVLFLTRVIISNTTAFMHK